MRVPPVFAPKFRCVWGERGNKGESLADDFKYDVFLSHSSKDLGVVRAVAERLRADGLRVWFDEWEIKPGHSILAKIEGWRTPECSRSACRRRRSAPSGRSLRATRSVSAIR